MQFILIYDIPRKAKSLPVKVNRILRSIDAKMIQQSVWESSDIERLKEIKNIIEENGGVAFILEKRVV